MDATEALREYIKIKKISVKSIAKSTGLPYRKLQSCLSANCTRKLRADEFLKVCFFLQIDPYRFCELPTAYEAISI